MRSRPGNEDLDVSRERGPERRTGLWGGVSPLLAIGGF